MAGSEDTGFVLGFSFSSWRLSQSICQGDFGDEWFRYIILLCTAHVTTDMQSWMHLKPPSTVSSEQEPVSLQKNSAADEVICQDSFPPSQSCCSPGAPHQAPITQEKQHGELDPHLPSGPWADSREGWWGSACTKPNTPKQLWGGKFFFAEARCCSAKCNSCCLLSPGNCATGSCWDHQARGSLG